MLPNVAPKPQNNPPPQIPSKAPKKTTQPPPDILVKQKFIARELEHVPHPPRTIARDVWTPGHCSNLNSSEKASGGVGWGERNLTTLFI